MLLKFMFNSCCQESPKAAEKDVENSHSENDENDASDDVVDITNGDEDEAKRDLEEENEKDRKINGDDAGSEVITVDDSIDIDPVPTKVYRLRHSMIESFIIFGRKATFTYKILCPQYMSDIGKKLNK